MRALWIFLAIVVAGYALAERVGQGAWTERSVAGLTIKLVDDPAKVEWLSFGAGGKVSVTWGTTWKDKTGFHRVVTTPWLDWKFVGGRVQIYDARAVAEELTFIRREGSHLILRMKGGKIGRFLIQRERV